MDMSATERLKALNHAGTVPASGKGASVHAGLGVHSDTPSARGNSRRAGRLLPVSGSASVAVSNTLLFTALSLFLAGCSVLQPATPVRNTPLPPPQTRVAQEAAPVTKPPEAPAKSAQPAPRPAQQVKETRPQPATASKGAEALVAPKMPAPVRVSEGTTIPAPPPAPKPLIVEDSGTVTGAVVKELIFRGPPRPPQSRMPGMKTLLWIGLGLGVAVLAAVACVCVVRRGKSSEAPDESQEESLPMPGLLFKEPTNLPQEAPVAEKA